MAIIKREEGCLFAKLSLSTKANLEKQTHSNEVVAFYPPTFSRENKMDKEMMGALSMATEIIPGEIFVV